MPQIPHHPFAHVLKMLTNRRSADTFDHRSIDIGHQDVRSSALTKISAEHILRQFHMIEFHLSMGIIHRTAMIYTNGHLPLYSLH